MQKFGVVGGRNTAGFVGRWRHRRRVLHAHNKLQDFTLETNRQDAVKHLTELFMTFWTRF